MTAWCRLPLVLAGLLLGLVACAPEREPSLASGDGGIGGTGISGDGGIGGTGIVGVITEFGSIVVNGRRIAIPPGLPIADTAGGVYRPQDLRVGHTVLVRAVERDGLWIAREVRRGTAVIGPVDGVGPDGVTVLGRTIGIDRATVVAGGPGATRLGDAAGLSPGDWVAVSGLPSGPGRIAASRIERLADPGPAGRPVAAAAPLSAALFDGRVDRLLLQTLADPQADRLSLADGGDAASAGIAGSRILEGRVEGGVLRIERREAFRGYRRSDEDADWDRPPAGWDGDEEADIDDAEDDDDVGDGEPDDDSEPDGGGEADEDDEDDDGDDADGDDGDDDTDDGDEDGDDAGDDD